MKLTEKLAQQDIDRLESLLDRLFKSLNIDIEFTRHFVDRVNDQRNGEDITTAELAELFGAVYQKYGKQLSKLSDDSQAVLNDIRSDINIPFVIDFNKRSGMLELISKTVMRKRNFKTSNKKYKVGEMKLAEKLFTTLGITESINDKNILKAVILAGGPGSGKSFVIDNVIGKAGPVSGLGVVISASDKFFERRLLSLDLPLKFGAEGSELFSKQMDARELAVIVAQTKLGHIIDGMLPLVLDGTGQNLDKIKRQKIALENIGYDVDMIFVNTSLEVAQERNQKRDRTLVPSVVAELWQTVQDNLGAFQSVFGNNRFHLIDNSKPLEGSDLKEFKGKMFKLGMRIFKEKLKNPKGKALIQALKSVKGKQLSDLKRIEQVPI